ncbi:AbgT family transporter [Luteococcus sp. Sow4_B9]|uniref:AbgT family transporter n=1 Tax=Luteococcus sp. Sow4_B9 TaxID=3438792 RepID=UPI003F97A80F
MTQTDLHTDVPPPHEGPARRSFGDRMLSGIEITGNRLPDPIFLFAGICALIAIASWICALAGVSVINPVDGKPVAVENLLNATNLRRMLVESVGNFSKFPALGMVLMIMLGIGLAEQSGWFSALMRDIVDKAPRALVVPVIALVGILGNVAGDAAPIVLPPLAAMLFVRLGWHPVAGIAAAYCAAVGGFAANLILGMSDALVFAFTKEAAQMVDPSVSTNVAMNYHFIAASVLVLLPVISIVTTKITIPRLGTYEGGAQMDDGENEVTPQQRKALRWANVTALVVLALFAALSLPSNGLLRNAETGSLLEKSPLMDGIIPLLTIFFFVPGLVYGMKAGTIRSTKDAGRMMTEAMASMGNFVVIVFFAAQMLAFFTWSNLGTVIAVTGAEVLKGQHGVVMILGILLLSSLLNMLLGSASAKWAILAPILVPMMMLLDYHPAFTQMIFRVGDSITNPITPMFPYFPLVLALAQKYDKRFGVGTLISATLPYSIAMGLAWTALLIFWFLMGWPVGISGPIRIGG